MSAFGIINTSNLVDKIQSIVTELKVRQSELITNDVWAGKASLNIDDKIEDVLTKMQNNVNRISGLKSLLYNLDQYENLQSDLKIKEQELISLQTDTLTNASAIELLETQINQTYLDLNFLKKNILSVTQS